MLWCAFSIGPSFAQEVDWPNYGNDIGNSRYANLDQINPSNVSQLKPAWVFHTGLLSDPSMSMEMTPIVVNGVMYVTSGDDDVFALNPTTGKQIWAYHPTDMPKISTLPVYERAAADPESTAALVFRVPSIGYLMVWPFLNLATE